MRSWLHDRVVRRLDRADLAAVVPDDCREDTRLLTPEWHELTELHAPARQAFEVQRMRDRQPLAQRNAVGAANRDIAAMSPPAGQHVGPAVSKRRVWPDTIGSHGCHDDAAEGCCRHREECEGGGADDPVRGDAGGVHLSVTC